MSRDRVSKHGGVVALVFGAYLTAMFDPDFRITEAPRNLITRLSMDRSAEDGHAAFVICTSDEKHNGTQCDYK